MDNNQFRYIIMLIYGIFSLIPGLIISRIIISPIKNENTAQYITIILGIIISFLFFKISMFRFDKKFNHTKIRNLREEGIALKKEATLFEFKEGHHKRRDEPNEYYCYFLAFDGEKYYKSNEFDECVQKPLGIFGTLLFKNLNIDFNPNKLSSYEGDKLNQLSKKIQNEKEILNIKIQESGTLKGFVLKKKFELIENAEFHLKSKEKAYIQRGKNKLTLGDKVTVYINPENPNDYRIDVDNYLYNK